MNKKLETYLSESKLDTEAKNVILEAWAEQINEAKDALREEFAQKYEHDKKVMAEAMDNFLQERLEAEINEFAEDKKIIAAERVENKRKIAEHLKVFDQFVFEKLKEELSEFSSDRKLMLENLQKLEGFVVKALAEEVKDLRAEKKQLIEQRVKLIAEGKRQLEEAKQKFFEQAAVKINEHVEKQLRKEVGQLRQDIREAKNNNFGRKIFETFASEFMSSHLNENTEVGKLNKKLAETNALLEAKQQEVVQARTLAEDTVRKLNATKDTLARTRVMSKLLAPLDADKRKVMANLLESVKTENLENSYNKYIDAVLNSNIKVSAKEKLSESTVEKTGDRAQAQIQDSVIDFTEMKRLAGIKD